MQKKIDRDFTEVELEAIRRELARRLAKQNRKISDCTLEELGTEFDKLFEEAKAGKR